MALQQLSDIYLATTITPGEKPGPNQLELGELAFNAADRLGFLGLGGGAYHEFTLGGGAAPGAGGITQGPAAPAAPVRGDVWVDTSGTGLPKLNIYDGASWAVLAWPDGVSIVNRPAPNQAELEVGTIDMGTF